MRFLTHFCRKIITPPYFTYWEAVVATGNVRRPICMPVRKMAISCCNIFHRLILHALPANSITRKLTTSAVLVSYACCV